MLSLPAGLYGSCIAAGLAEAGAVVYIASRNIENYLKLAGKLNGEGYKVAGAELDQASTENITKLRDRILKEE